MTADGESPIRVRYVDAVELHPPRGYRHASIATGATIIHCAGQVAVGADGAVIGAGDYEMQSYRALLNVVAALSAAGASSDDVVKVTYYVVGMAESTVRKVNRGLGRAVAETGFPAAPATMVGVTALSIPELLIEADAVAVTD